MVWRRPAVTMLPLAVTTVPLVLLLAGGWLVLFLWAYPEVQFEEPNILPENMPNGLLFWIMVLTWAWALFTAVGFAGAIVAVRRSLDGLAFSLPLSLDPAFTRMGGLLVIGLTFYAIIVLAGVLAVTVIGALLMVYVFLRVGLAIHAYILEDVSSRAALRLSWATLRNHVLGLLVITVIAVPVALVLITGAAIVIGLASVPFTSEEIGRDGTVVLNAIGVLIGGLALVPTLGYLAAASTIYYCSLRNAARA